jgi:predicted dithiol-disulfide oxidoreductase (DUF899 family)
MTTHKTGTREEWLAARVELLKAEKELTRQGDEITWQRLDLPWVRVDKDYEFDTDDGPVTLPDLFGGRSQLMVYHFMFGPDYSAGCPSCSAIADGFNGFFEHLENHDVAFTAISRAPLEKLNAYKQRMGWRFPWASSFRSDFNYDFGASFTEEQQREGGGDYNFGPMSAYVGPMLESAGAATAASFTGTDTATFARELQGMSSFVREDGVVYHAYSTYARGVDALRGMSQWLDRAPKGRNESSYWIRRRGEY